jgi:metal-responsive CopG/Arc/MetJ family transcriptional regulator
MSVNTVRFQIVFPKWLRDEVEIAAKNKGISMSELIKDSIKTYLEHDRRSKSHSE